MDKDKIKEEIKKIMKSRMDITILDSDENFFGRNLNVPSIDMVCLFFEFSKLFQVEIDDSFIERLPSITLNNLAEAISLSME